MYAVKTMEDFMILRVFLKLPYLCYCYLDCFGCESDRASLNAVPLSVFTFFLCIVIMYFCSSWAGYHVYYQKFILSNLSFFLLFAKVLHFTVSISTFCIFRIKMRGPGPNLSLIVAVR